MEQNIKFNSVGFFSFFRNIFFNLFKKKSKESTWESRKESTWDSDYSSIDGINFAEIFANRLTNYTLDGLSYECDDETIAEAVKALFDKSYKWVQMAFGVGRVFLVPYVAAGKIYTDIIPQGRAWVTSSIGDDVTGIGVLADIRTENNRKYYRMASYEYDPLTKVFTIENKATNANGAEIALSTFKEWESIEPTITIKGVEKPLFAFCDCPKDNRTTDRLQGAPITFGCEDTIKEIKDTLKQYCEEYDLKRAWLGVDRIMLGKDGQPESRLFRTFDGKSTENLFEIFSPDIRDVSYRQRMLDLFARLEKQVGTSNGILTPADVANVTATQVRRSMYDTLSMVNRMRQGIDKATEVLVYCYRIYYGLIGKRVPDGASVSTVWSDPMLYDSAERFQQLTQARGYAVADEEIRRFLFPNEDYEVTKAKIQEIRESAPEPTIPEFFGE